MEKKIILFEGPVDTFSGYGKHAADICKSVFKIFDREKYEIRVLSLNWGNMSFGALNDSDPEEKMIKDSMVTKTSINYIPDIYFQVTLPVEFQKKGKFNIGITAGTETSIASREFVEGCNRMDMIIVPSKFTKEVLESSQWIKRDPTTMIIEEDIKIKVPIEVLFEGINEKVYYKTKEIDELINKEFSKIDEDFCFLFTGQWLKGTIGNDRKDIGMLIHTFTKAFMDQEKMPALVLKTAQNSLSVIDKDDIIDKIDEIRNLFEGHKRPKIYLLYGSISDDQMNSMYNHPKVKAMVNFTHGEGFGRPLLEFSVTGKPILVSDWSGQLDFLPPSNAVLLKGRLEKIDPSAVWAGVLIPESSWFRVDYDYAMLKMQSVFQSSGKYIEMGRKQANYTKNYTLNKMTEKFTEILQKHKIL